jgi:hypothetical protein
VIQEWPAAGAELSARPCYLARLAKPPIAAEGTCPIKAFQLVLPGKMPEIINAFSDLWSNAEAGFSGANLAFDPDVNFSPKYRFRICSKIFLHRWARPDNDLSTTGDRYVSAGSYNDWSRI